MRAKLCRLAWLDFGSGGTANIDSHFCETKSGNKNAVAEHRNKDLQAFSPLFHFSQKRYGSVVLGVTSDIAR